MTFLQDECLIELSTPFDAVLVNMNEIYVCLELNFNIGL